MQTKQLEPAKPSSPVTFPRVYLLYVGDVCILFRAIYTYIYGLANTMLKVAGCEMTIHIVIRSVGDAAP